MSLKEKKPLLYYHENWWKVKDASVWYLAGKCIENPDLPVAKWYFSDEASLLNGPYDSREEAEAALAAYSGHL